MYDLIGGIVPDELLKECQRRLTTDTNLNLGHGPGGKNWRPLILYIVYERRHIHMHLVNSTRRENWKRQSMFLRMHRWNAFLGTTY